MSSADFDKGKDPEAYECKAGGSTRANKPADDSINAQEEGRATLRKEDEENGPKDEENEQKTAKAIHKSADLRTPATFTRMCDTPRKATAQT